MINDCSSSLVPMLNKTEKSAYFSKVEEICNCMLLPVRLCSPAAGLMPHHYAGTKNIAEPLISFSLKPLVLFL